MPAKKSGIDLKCVSDGGGRRREAAVDDAVKRS